MAETKYKSSKICNIPNPAVDGYKMTALNSMTINGTTLYLLKSQSKQNSRPLNKVVLCKVEKFDTVPKVTSIEIKKGGEIVPLSKHSNGITYAKKPKDKSGYLYIATMNTADQPQMYKLSLSGVVKKGYYYIKNGVKSKFNSIDYIGMENNKMKFVLGTGFDSTGTKFNFDFAYLVGNNLEYTGITLTGTNIPKGFVSNDIYYYSGKVYLTAFIKNAEGHIFENKVFLYNAKNLTASKSAKPSSVMIVNRPTTKLDSTFEVEGIVRRGSIYYTANNCISTIDKAWSKDAVFKLTKQS